ncbi:MAG: DUF438 domain-containing protein [Candidatus Aminicenantes bacterium]|nr:DUF438 domain-containing protein [Candidatus Aminicenantes bacterium]
MNTNANANKKEILKDIIRDLHRGGDVEGLRKRFAQLVRDVSGGEIAAMEQELISEGLPEEAIKKLCDVHVRVFKDSLEGQPASAYVPGHPLHTLAAENKELEKIVARTRDLLALFREEAGGRPGSAEKAKLASLLNALAEVEKHYLKKENQLFPRLEEKGKSGPSKVMWAIHDDIRAHLKDFRRALDIGDRVLVDKTGTWVLQEISDMIYKEEKILFPMSLEILDELDWVRVKKGEEEIGYAWITPGREWRPAAPPEAAEAGAKTADGSRLALDTGVLSAEQVNLLLTNLPVDISFVDENDTVVYYSATRERIFPRTPGVIGRKVQNCHPPKSFDVVTKILDAFRDGGRDVAEFWIELNGKFIHIRYFAMRDGGGKYRGSLEVSQDVTGIRALRGEKRLLDWAPPGLDV